MTRFFNLFERLVESLEVIAITNAVADIKFDTDKEAHQYCHKILEY